MTGDPNRLTINGLIPRHDPSTRERLALACLRKRLAQECLSFVARDRIDSGIAHEHEEAKGGVSHEYGYEHAPEMELPIRHEARELARKTRDGERRRRH